MNRRYGLPLLVLLLASPALIGADAALAQQVDTVIIYRDGPPPPEMKMRVPPLPPPGAEMDGEIILRRDDGNTVYFLRRHGAEDDTLHAYIRRLPERHRFRLHTDSVRLHVDSLLLSGRLRIDMDSLRARFFGRDSTLRRFGRLDIDSLAGFHIWRDSIATPHVFRLHADSLRLRTPLRWHDDAPSAGVEFWGDDVEVTNEGDSTVVRLRRIWPGDAPHRFERFVVPRGALLRPEQRADGVLVVPDGQGGTWIYVPPKEEGEE